MPPSQRAAESFLPLKSIELLILTVLSERSRHGYGIREDILEQTKGQVSIEAGNLYRHLRGLEDDALIDTAPAPRTETDERRIYYRLTPLGRRVLAAELVRLRSLVRLAEERGIITRSRA
jgi:DNA-binding PadR family transcriptional regulator